MAKRWYYKDENGNKVPVPQYKIDADDYYTKAMSDSRYYEKSATDTMLATKVDKTDITQSTGTSETAVMSQKAVSDAINKLKNAGYLYAGITTPTTNPGTPEVPVFYIANGKGTYTNFGGIDVIEDEVVILYYDTVWHKDATGIASNDKLTELKEKCVDYFNQNITISNDRLERIINIGNSGKKVRISVNLVSGIDSESWRVYGTNQDGTTFDPENLIVSDTNFGDTKEFIVPSNGFIYIFTTAVLSSERTYNVICGLSSSLENQINDLENQIDKLEEVYNESNIEINGSKYYKSAEWYRLEEALYIGHPNEEVYINFNVKSGTDTGNYRIYGTNNHGESANFNDILVSDTPIGGESKKFTVPSDGYIWLFTIDSPLQHLRVYEVIISLSTTITHQINTLFNLTKKPLDGKTIVCFGDSITEFNHQGKRYTDWLAEITGANVINVGIGGTQIRQRAEPTLTPTYSDHCYANLDIINMVKAATSGDFSYVRAGAQKLAEISDDDNTAIVERLAAINWQNVDYVILFAGTNDWTGNNGNTGTVDSTDINYTCGALNKIIELLNTTYKKVQFYYFTPIIRVFIPDFSESVQYQVGDRCRYGSPYYKFINAHQGAWNASDVEETTNMECRVAAYYSNNLKLNGKTLREFSELLYTVVHNNNVPVCDMYNTLGWNLYNFNNFFDNTDSTHPFYGFEQIAEKISKFILSN